MTLRGIHVNAFTQDVKRTLEQGRPSLVKTLDFAPDWAALKQQHDIRFLLGRVWCDDDAALTPTPEAAAQRLYVRARQAIGTRWAALDALESPWNEAHQRGDDLARHAIACRRFCELAHRDGMKVAVGCFSVGNPEPSEFAAFAPGLELADYLALHEYWLASGNFNAPWWVGRYRLLLDALPVALRRPVIVSECGIDGGLEGRTKDAGWRGYGMTPTAYAVTLNYCINHYWDADVLGVAVFNCGDYSGGRWGSFEIANTPAVEAWLAAGPREWTPVAPPTPEPEPEPLPEPAPGEYVVGPGVAAAMAAEGDEPANHEVYLLPGPDYLSLTLGASGILYVATPRTGVVAYDPKAPAL